MTGSRDTEDTGTEDIDLHEVQARLQSEFGVDEYAAGVVANGLGQVSGEALLELRKWLATGELPRLEVEGFSTESLVKTGDSNNPVGALIILDDLLKNPRAAKRRLRRGKDEFFPRRSYGAP